MNLTFKKVALHHFMSFGDAEVDLRGRGFCLVVGRNGDARDAAKSNGSGKSAVFNAVSYALTGATLQGLRSNLANMTFGDGCWVRLEFDADGHEYEIVRSKDDPKLGTNLRLKVDGVDKSGKGLRESQAVLEGLLPDLTPELLGSVVMLGQGMPMRLTADTPSGRKETLEHLSKSDFMIQDLKDRIAKRSSELDALKRKLDDAALVNSTKSEAAKGLLASSEALLASLRSAGDPSALLEGLRAKRDAAAAESKRWEAEAERLKGAEASAQKALSEAKEAKARALESIAEQHAEAKAEYAAARAKEAAAASSLEGEIARLESIKDICPTCGQRIPNVVKPDVSPQRKALADARARLAALGAEEAEDERAYAEARKGVSAKYDGDVSARQTESDTASAERRGAEARAKGASSEASEAGIALAKAEADAKGMGERIAAAEADVEARKGEIAALESEAAGLASQAQDVDARRSAESKLATMAKRDFRGILLEGVIQYIGAKVKEFSSEIFGTDGVSFELDGNDISISYGGKDYENLSGGERQRVDLIVQFALRDMMCHYLGFSANMLVLDEISDALDAVSCRKVMGFISSSLSEVESVFVVSHHADELDIPVDGEITVVKDERGISTIKQ